MKTITPQIRRAALPLPPSVTATGSSIALHIDSVVLHGFSRSDGRRATAALQSELTRLITDHGLPQFSDRAPHSIDAGTVRASAGRPELTGTRAARAIHGGLRS